MINKSIFHSCHKEGFGSGEVFSAYKVFFGTLVSDSRLKIINFLRGKSANVSEIMGELKMDQTQVSHDLSRLKKCGFVLSSVNGKFRDYSLNDETIKPLMSLIDKHMSEYCIHILRENKDDERGERK